MFSSTTLEAARECKLNFYVTEASRKMKKQEENFTIWMMT